MISIEEKKAARLTEWTVWLKDFMDINSDVVPIPNAAELLNDYYWRLALFYLKPLLEYSEEEKEHNLHYYKIISASELTIMAVMPFKLKAAGTEESKKQANAEYAWFVATSILINWQIADNYIIDTEKLDQIVYEKEVIDVIDSETKYYPLNFMDEHIEWLKDLNTAGPLPILSNSQTWRVLFLASKADHQN